jgi:hypothetical protein
MTDEVRWRGAAIALALVVASASASTAKPPTFADYRVPEVAEQHPKLDLKSHPRAARYRTLLREAVNSGPRVAGHYVLASWGCGTQCEEFAVIDVSSGKVSFPTPSMATYPQWPEPCSSEHYGLEFHPDSRLLVIYGVPEHEKKPGAYYYVWSDPKLERVDFEAGCPSD